MEAAKQMKCQHTRELKPCADHDHDLVHELGGRLDSLWRMDQYIANAKDHSEIQDFWKEVKTQEQRNVMRLKQLISNEIRDECF